MCKTEIYTFGVLGVCPCKREVLSSHEEQQIFQIGVYYMKKYTDQPKFAKFEFCSGV